MWSNDRQIISALIRVPDQISGSSELKKKRSPYVASRQFDSPTVNLLQLVSPLK